MRHIFPQKEMITGDIKRAGSEGCTTRPKPVAMTKVGGEWQNFVCGERLRAHNLLGVMCGECVY